MFKKSIVLSTSTETDNCKALEGVKSLGISVIDTKHNSERYDIFMFVTKEEAYELLELADKLNGILWTGEEES